MLRIQISGKVYNFDPSKLPSGSAFDEIVSFIVSGTAAPLDLVDLAYLYRNDFRSAKQLLEIARRKSELEDAPGTNALNEVKITMLGLLMHHNVATEIDFFELNNLQDKRIDLLKGLYLYKKRNLEDALFLFNKVGYRTGIDLCRVEMSGRETLPEPSDSRMLCYVNPEKWKDFTDDNANKDFLFRIGRRSTPGDENNIDSRLELVEQEIASGEYDFESVLSKLEVIKNVIPNSSEVYYLMGKLFHLKNDYERAREYYDLSLVRDPSYLPAMYNLRRISGKPMPVGRKSMAISDYNAIINLMNGLKDFDYSNCSPGIRKVCAVVSKVRVSDTSGITDLEEMCNSEDYKGMFGKEVLINNLAILKGANGLKLLEGLLNDYDDHYEDYIKYNIGVLRGDAEILASCGLGEAKLHLAMLNNDTSVEDKALRGYVYMNTDKSAAKEFFKKSMRESTEKVLASYINDPSLFFLICLGSLYIDDYLLQSDKSDTSALDQSVAYFTKAQKSFYAVNGLGIVHALKGNLEEAIYTFNEIADEYNLAYLNIAHCYVLKGEYIKAIESLLKLDSASRDKSVDLLVKELCQILGDANVLSHCIKHGFTGLNLDISVKSELNTHGGRDVSESRKRKIQEIEAARKRLNLQ